MTGSDVAGHGGPAHHGAGRHRRPVNTAWVAAASGFGCLAAAGALALATPAVIEDAGTLPAAFQPAGVATATQAAPGGAVRTVRLAMVPHRLRIPSLNMTAEVDPVTVRGRSELAVPADPHRLGWWIGGAAPGSATGTVVIAGHVDDAKVGPGALYRLEKLAMGAVVEIDGAGGKYRYKVVARRLYEKADLPAELFQRGGTAQLALITCGGKFTPGHGYERNVVVYATLA